ncbi:response regulator [Hyalangium versicolor]|uniref:response regulator n=1 Tax=Hyalangium versicolor TaxID=2861190 RepID=UPI001CCD6B15|nr:response regulator [Hyalangium versicolor]
MNVVNFWDEETTMTRKHGERILVVDDEFDVREGLAKLLAMEGYDVATAENGTRALERARAAEFDLVLTDLRMPGMSGVETLVELKKLQPDVMVIVVTGFASDATAANCVREGAYDVVHKPFDLNQLLSLIEKALDTGKGARPLPT